MLGALNTAATGMGAQAKQLDVISNNIANADTTSFKKSRADFEDLLYQNSKDPGAATSATTQNPTGVQVGVGVRTSGTTREFTDGSLKPTGRNLDVAISGNGFFSVQKPNGNLAYTRDGGFKVGSEGRLENANGYPVVPEITIPAGTKQVDISPDGKVSILKEGTTPEEVGQIQLTQFANPSGLQAEGGNIYSPTPASGTPAAGSPGDDGMGTLVQKFLEASNVNPMGEMTDMIRAQRVYELNSKVITTTDQMMSTLNQIR
jgi:flagellar basal-body rod protein FlgG